jgi:tetratricopeptide (TPR) repeat protein
VEACRWPCAITAARLLTRPAWPLSEYANRLRDEHERLERLEVGDLSVRASFNLSYDLLSADEQRAFRSVGFFGGPRFVSPALSAAAEFDISEAVEAVIDAQLLTSGASGVLDVHDLLRLYARERLETEEDEGRLESGLRALAVWYRHQAELRHAAILGSATDEPPLAWLDRELGNIAAVARQLADQELWDVAAALVMDVGPLYGASQAWRAWDELLTVGESTADALADRRLLTKITLNRGIVADNLGDADRGGELLAEAEAMAREVGDVGDEARAVAQQGTILKNRGDAEGASKLTRRALELHARGTGSLAARPERTPSTPRCRRLLSWLWGTLVGKAGIGCAAEAMAAGGTRSRFWRSMKRAKGSSDGGRVCSTEWRGGGALVARCLSRDQGHGGRHRRTPDGRGGDGPPWCRSAAPCSSQGRRGLLGPRG